MPTTKPAAAMLRGALIALGVEAAPAVLAQFDRLVHDEDQAVVAIRAAVRAPEHGRVFAMTGAIARTNAMSGRDGEVRR